MEIKEILHQLHDNGALHSERIHISVGNARERLFNGLRYYLGKDAKWIAEYEEVAEWLHDNKGKGLMLMGSNGRGKSVLATKIIPWFFREKGYWCEVYHASELNKKKDEAKETKILCVDDVGIEDLASRYGERINVFMELMDEVERKDKLIIITTNLTRQALEYRYTTRTTDRINGCCKVVVFNGTSMRK